MFWVLVSVFGFRDVFWILGYVLSLRYHILISYPWDRAISWILYSLDWAQCKVNT